MLQIVFSDLFIIIFACDIRVFCIWHTARTEQLVDNGILDHQEMQRKIWNLFLNHILTIKDNDVMKGTLKKTHVVNYKYLICYYFSQQNLMSLT